MNPSSAVIDLRERDLGWEGIPPEPSGAPSSISQVLVDYTPSPEDWRDEVFYSVLIDRFDRADPCSPWGDPMDARTRHGGNLRGLAGRLDYLRGLGATALLLNPVFMNPPAGYHQYWPVHFMAVDPHLGTMEDLRGLIAEAHARGMRVILDMVFNHTGPILEYRGGPAFGPRKEVRRWRYPLKPVELAREEHFSLRGDIADWNDPEQRANGDLPGGINRLRTEHPLTQDILLRIAKWWIQATDADGFRLDAYCHVSRDFWTRLFVEAREFARGLGKKDFLLLGELFDGNPAHYLPELRGGRLGAAYNYPAYFWNDKALHADAPARDLEDGFLALRGALGERLHHMVNFIGNHDRPHFLREGDSPGLILPALAHVLAGQGIPYLYGEEQARRRVPEREWLDVEAPREDRFRAGAFKNPADPSDGFETGSPGYRAVRSLTRARERLAALRRGEQYPRWSDPSGPGICAFSRIYRGEEALVVLNTSAEPRSAGMPVDKDLSPGGTAFVDALDPGYGAAARSEGGGSRVRVEVPGHGVRILIGGSSASS
jgi:alpha-amylase